MENNLSFKIWLPIIGDGSGISVVRGEIVDNSFRPNLFGVEISGYSILDQTSERMLCLVTSTEENMNLLILQENVEFVGVI